MAKPLLLILSLALLAVSWSAGAEDRHAGYYYPEPVTQETYVSRAQTMIGASRPTRLGFVTGIAALQAEKPYPSEIAMFAKGEEAEKLLIISMVENRMNTLFRARAMLAMLTASARLTDIFREYQVEDLFTFLDLCKLLGFSQVTVSDGRTYSHQIHIQ